MQIPAWILEGSNGATALALLWVFSFQLTFLIAAYDKIQNPLSFYHQMKPVIALTVMAGGFLLRFADIWEQRFAERHGLKVMLPEWTSVAVHIFGTAAAIVGLLCWLRVTMPEFCGFRTWLVLVALALGVLIFPTLL